MILVIEEWRRNDRDAEFADKKSGLIDVGLILQFLHTVAVFEKQFKSLLALDDEVVETQELLAFFCELSVAHCKTR